MKMKNSAIILLLLLVVHVECRERHPVSSGNKILMAVDSILTDKNVRTIRQGDAVRPEESIKELGNLPNIMKYDLDTTRISSKELRYVKPGEAVRPSE